jgi:hypothetical protein
MSDGNFGDLPPTGTRSSRKAERNLRLEQELRANLRRRKEQARARTPAPSADTPAAPEAGTAQDDH